MQLVGKSASRTFAPVESKHPSTSLIDANLSGLSNRRGANYQPIWLIRSMISAL